MNNSTKFLVNKKDSGKRLDIFLSKKISHLTRSYIKKIIETKQVAINKKIVTSPSKKIKTDDSINIKNSGTEKNSFLEVTKEIESVLNKLKMLQFSEEE